VALDDAKTRRAAFSSHGSGGASPYQPHQAFLISLLNRMCYLLRFSHDSHPQTENL
jgi:hypothetical protein